MVGDLHIGFENRFRNSGISIQSTVKPMVSEIRALLETYKITDLLINGDLKSGVDRISQSEWENVPSFLESLADSCKISVIPGNHDGGLRHLLPDGVELLDGGGLLISGWLVFHGNSRPLDKFRNCRRIVIGHLHPIFQEKGSPLSGQPAWVIARVERKRIFEQVLPDSDEREEGGDLVEVIVMPAFNRELIISGFVPDAARQERKNAPMLRSLRTSEDALVMTLNGEIIGDASTLQRIL